MTLYSLGALESILGAAARSTARYTMVCGGQVLYALAQVAPLVTVHTRAADPVQQLLGVDITVQAAGSPRYFKVTRHDEYGSLLVAEGMLAP